MKVLSARHRLFIDFRPRRRFSRAEGKPPRRVCSCGVLPIPLFPQESPSFLKINRLVLSNLTINTP